MESKKTFESANKLSFFFLLLLSARALCFEWNMKSVYECFSSSGFSGADIANICNEAALIAARCVVSQRGQCGFSWGWFVVWYESATYSVSSQMSYASGNIR